MEVNVCPSLSSSSPMDRKIKHTLLTDTLNMFIQDSKRLIVIFLTFLEVSKCSYEWRMSYQGIRILFMPVTSKFT
jgi:hypothetical protein